MSRLFYVTAAAAMFASVTAFAQTDKPAATPDTTASAPADSSMPADKTEGKMHHHHKMMRSAKNGSTDFDADKLNACMSNATPTNTQESCLKQAEGAS
jgi:hypothetical protein